MYTAKEIHNTSILNEQLNTYVDVMPIYKLLRNNFSIQHSIVIAHEMPCLMITVGI